MKIFISIFMPFMGTCIIPWLPSLFIALPLTARLGTATTRFGTAAAMLVVVLGTFSSTAVASLGTNRAQLHMEVRSATHKSGTKSAKIGAIAAGFDASSHHLHHATVLTGSGAKFTVLEAF